MPLPATASDDDLWVYLKALRLREEVYRYSAIEDLYPDDGPLAWHQYKKHFELWKLGATENERCLLAANRVGKTIAGGFEVATHLTGRYRQWWPGVRFNDSVNVWACGDTTDTVRDIIQPLLLGRDGDWGSGLIPLECILDVMMRRGGGNAVDSVRVRHAAGNISVLQFKSYEQGRKSFQGTKMQLVWLDEEPSMDIYSECVIRTMGTVDSTPGHLICTFTPLLGMSEVVLKFLPGGRMP